MSASTNRSTNAAADGKSAVARHSIVSAVATSYLQDGAGMCCHLLQCRVHPGVRDKPTRVGQPATTPASTNVTCRHNAGKHQCHMRELHPKGYTISRLHAPRRAPSQP
jgi:hypothetical protein